ncbi:MAG: 3-oxoacyl-[acyl-carrier-protein] reductase [Planctomycetes bacterium]|nr:3-oxoacyl-[acyl-carrier-protein] reductase [Planctomycetota bacterium]
MNIDLTARAALVTGGARGIGRAIGLALAEHGAAVGLVDVDEAAGQEAARAITAAGGRAVFECCDVTSPAEVPRTTEAVRQALGGLDILVNNAGITRDTLLVRMKDDDWTRVLDVNLTGAFLFTRAAARHLMRAAHGRIINIASVVGMMGNAGQANYAASKGGLIALSKAVARELAPRGVTVNAIAPGFIETEMTAGLDDKAKAALHAGIPLGRGGKPEDVASGVVFLASDLASYITGHVLVIAGGMAM